MLGVVFALVLAGCGGAQSTDDDKATVIALLSSNAEVQGAMQALYTCPLKAVECYVDAGPEIVAVVDRERGRLTEFLRETDDECLATVGELYGDSLDEYAEAGKAAEAGDLSGADEALERSTRIEMAYTRKIGTCGLEEERGRAAELSAAFRAIDVETSRIAQGLGTCGDEACVRRQARELEVKARKGELLLEEYVTELGGEGSSCLAETATTVQASYGALKRAAIALGQGEYTEFEEVVTRSDELRLSAQKEMAACAASSG